MKSLAIAAAMSFVFASFNAQATDIITKLNGGNLLTVPSITPYNAVHFAGETSFYDDYTFTVADSVSNSVTSSVSFANFYGITNLQARLYLGSTHETGATPFIQQAWSTSLSTDAFTTVSTVALGAKALAAGTYTLQVRGTVSGLGGGGYAGVLNIAAVPEADTYAMLIAGLGVMGLVARRKSNKV